MIPKYLNKQGGFRITNLFIDICNRELLNIGEPGINFPEFTFAPDDWTDVRGNVFKSMRKLFLECGDVTGYDFAITVLGSYEHFRILSEHKLVGPQIESWQNEMKAKIDSFAVKNIEKIVAEGGTQVQLSAAKYLANRDYEEKGPVGKPATNNKKLKEETHARETARETKEEMERLGMTH